MFPRLSVGRRAIQSAGWPVDFNVKVHKRFIDKISDCTLQLVFKNYYLWSFGLVSKKKILNIWKAIKLHFPTTHLCEMRFSLYLSIKTACGNTLNAEADMRSWPSSIKLNIKEMYKNIKHVTLVANFILF